MSDDLLGQQLDEYRLLALLGRGGMARVYLGLDVRLKRYVSIKVIDPPFRSDPGYVQRFEREAQAVARLEHPHIVRLYRYGQANGLLYMAMQYVEGADLASLLGNYRQNGQFILPADAQRIAGEVCQALDYAHARGVIHRDVKSSNILVDRQGHAYLTDFGLALFALTASSEEHFGTPQYMAPEQVVSPTGAVPQSDFYGLGVVLYEMFTGQVPFDADDPMQIAAMQVNEAPRPPRRLRAELSPALEAVILKSLAKNPQDRYPSGAVLAEALGRAMQSPPVTPITPAYLTMGERVTAELQRQPVPPRGPAPAGRPAARRVAPPPPRPASHRRSMSVPAPRPAPRPRRGGRCLAMALFLLLLALLAGAGLLLAAQGDLDPLSWLPFAGGGGGRPSPTVAAGEPTFTPEPTALPPTETVPPTEEPLPTDTPLPPTDTPTPEPTATPEPQIRWELEVAMQDDNILYLINRSGEAFPLPRLRLGDGDRAVPGTAWRLAELPPGACVVVVKNRGGPAEQQVECALAGRPVLREPSEVVWNKDFDVYFDDQPVGTCAKEGCLIQVPDL